jgi:hypothetical protein
MQVDDTPLNFDGTSCLGVEDDLRFGVGGVFGLLPELRGRGTGLKFAGKLVKSSLLSSSSSAISTCLVSDFRGRGLGFLRMLELLDLVLFLLTPLMECPDPLKLADQSAKSCMLE